MLQKQDLQDY